MREKHWHTSVEIFAVMEGSLDFFVNKEEYPLKAGEQIIINSNEIHSIHAVEKNKTVVLQLSLIHIFTENSCGNLQFFMKNWQWMMTVLITISTPMVCVSMETCR